MYFLLKQSLFQVLCLLVSGRVPWFGTPNCPLKRWRLAQLLSSLRNDPIHGENDPRNSYGQKGAL